MSKQSLQMPGALAFLILAMASGALAAGANPLRVPAPAFPNLSAASRPAAMPAAQPDIKGLRAYHRAEIDPALMGRRLQGFRGGAFALDLGAYKWDLELEPADVRSPGYTVRHLTSKGVVTVEPQPLRSWRGRLRGKPGSRVRLDLDEGRISGFVEDGSGGRVYVEPMENFLPGSRLKGGPVSHALYREADVVPDKGVTCGIAEPASPVHPGGLAPWGQDGSSAGGSGSSPLDAQEIPMPKALPKAGAAGILPEACGLVELAVAADYSMVRGLGSAAAVEKRINEIYNMVDALYQDPAINLHVRITEIFIETENSLTWGATRDINQYLNNFSSWMRGPNGFRKPFDVGSMWYHHLGGGTVGLAWVGVICNNNRSNVIRYFSATSRSLMIDAAHELGHNFSAPHISNPAWLMNPGITGSNDKWDPSTISKITAHKNSRTCLSACSVAPIAGFAISGGSSCSETRTFTDQSAGEPASWLWDFGDGSTSTQRNPTHTYAADGRYTVKLTATNAFGSHTAAKGDIRVKDIEAPAGKDADGCSPSALTLSATGTGTLRWYDTAVGGVPLATGATFTTPVLTRARTYYVENGEADLPPVKLGPSGPSIGPGQMFTTTGDRRLFFDVARPATLVSVKVSAGSAGPRLVEVLDSKDKRILSRTVQVPAGESRIQLGFVLQPGNDYAIKVVGSGDSLNLFRNASGADYPYASPDTLVTITGSDATADDSITQSGYYYFFYDWEVRELGCASARTPVQAKLNCTTRLSSATGGFRASLRPLSGGHYRLEGLAPEAGTLSLTFRAMDGSLLRRSTHAVAEGALSVPLELGGFSSKLILMELQLGKNRLRQTIPRF